MEATRNLVRQHHGKEQLTLANPSLNSLHERLKYCQIHYWDLKDLLAAKLADKSLIEVIASNDENEANDLHSRVGAYVTALVQSLHSIEDIAAHAVYYALALNKAPKPLPEQAINGETVVKELAMTPAYDRVREVLERLDHSEEAKHLNALANISKHRSIVRTSINEDWTGERPERHVVMLEDVKYKGDQFPAVVASEFAATEFERCSRLVVLLGQELNAVLGALGSP